MIPVARLQGDTYLVRFPLVCQSCKGLRVSAESGSTTIIRDTDFSVA